MTLRSPLGDGLRDGPEGDVPTPAGTPVVVLVSSSWAGPSRPAPTVLRELSRRWGHSVHTMLIEDPTDEILETLQIEHLPTWMRFVPGHPSEGVTPQEEEGNGAALDVTELRGTGIGGEALSLEGPWTLTHRRSGALPKHVIDAEFGPVIGPVS